MPPSVSRETSSLAGIDPFLHYLVERPTIKEWLHSFTNENKDPASLTGAHGLLIPPLLKHLNTVTRSPILCVCENRSFSHTLYELLLFLVSSRVDRLLGVDPIDAHNTSSPDLESLRDEQNLNLFLSGRLPFLVTTLHVFENAMFAPSRTARNKIAITCGKPLSLGSLKDDLASWSYERVDEVMLPGSFAVRGGIVDVFPLDSQLPLRIELVGNTPESLRHFDPVSQRMIQAEQPTELTLHCPYRISPSASAQHTLRSVLPDTAIGLFINISGEDVYDLVPCSSPPDEDTTPVDLGCLPYGPFRGKETVLRETLSYLSKKQSVVNFVFFDPAFSDRVNTDPVLKQFLPVPSPFKGALYSAPLSMFCLSLDYLYTLPNYLPAPRRPERTDAPVTIPRKILDDFQWGGLMVHEDFGLGQYRGLSTLDTLLGKQECVSLEFAGGDRVYVPFDRLDRVHSYVGASEKRPLLSSLGSTKWRRAKQQTRRSAEKVVEAFIELYARRHKTNGVRFSPDSELHAALKRSFPYDETVDQLKAYDDIKQDMEVAKPMDRLVCGDVGFGKTEIALRAAFKATYDNKQVAVLAPTTILANQHYLTFQSRLGPLGVRVGLLSRFTGTDQQKQVIEKLKFGKLDLVVGTHRLLSKDVGLADLGLLVIDDEHRFGAQDKESLKKVRVSVDVLTMSATPIPRTLQFSLIGIRDVSCIRTPPKERLPIITKVIRLDFDAIGRAVAFEVNRGGQVFFVHNDLKTINRLAEQLQTLFPHLTVAIAHGQLPGKTLQAVMIDFLSRKIDVLVCTTIIEAGIDLPNVNTIVIHNAHRFGLSQLYQMRGRVGRGHRQAYCYLVVPKSKLTPAAHDRLRTIEYYSSLGSGYAISLKDLEMRGAGNLFGVEQSGHIAAVGFHLFCKIVEEVANQKLNKGPIKLEKAPADVSFEGTALIPKSYISDVADRLYFYRRLSHAAVASDIDDVRDEMEDRFGSLPHEASNLVGVASARLSVRECALTKLNISRTKVTGVLTEGASRDLLLPLAHDIQSTLTSLDYAFDVVSLRGGELTFSVAPHKHTDNDGFRIVQDLFDSIRSSANFHDSFSLTDATN